MRVVVAGTPEVAVPSLEAVLDSRHEVAAVITRPDARAGRGRGLRPSPVKARALESGIEVLTPPTAKDEDFVARLREIAPEAAPVVAYGNLVPPAVLAIPTHGWINLHFSLLPAWRGAAPVQHALIAGDTVTGASTFRLEEGLDTGPVFRTLRTGIDAEETAGELLDRLAVAGARLLVETLDGIEDEALTPTPQAGEPTHAPKLTKDDARIDWNRPATSVHSRVRGCTPAPGAWTVFRGETFKIHALRVVTGERPDLAPGQLHAERTRLLVGTADGVLELVTVQPQGKKPMAGADWARGARVDGEIFDA